MPDAYTHMRCARAARAHSGVNVPRARAYEMGSHGPDPLIAAEMLSRTAPPGMLALARRMHTEQCGRFLRALVFGAVTPAQRSYALGFLTHYAADSTFHPYVAFQCGAQGQFGGAFGHARCESSLDSLFCAQDTGSPAVPPRETVPALEPDALAEVTALLHDALRAVYGAQVTHEALADAFDAFARAHRLAWSPRGGKRALVSLAAFLGRPAPLVHYARFALAHMTPAPQPEGGFAERWTDPYTHKAREGGPQQLFAEASELADGYLKAAAAYWEGRSIRHTLAIALGDRSYMTGLLSEPAPASQEGT